MNKILASAMVLVASALADRCAAGILDPEPAYPVSSRYSRFAPAPYDWSGLYVGVNGGASLGQATWRSDPDLTSGTAGYSSGVLGGTIGYNAQTIGSFVYGTEFDFDWRQANAIVPPDSCAPNCQLTSVWLATGRVRFGYAFNYLMPYVTAGVAMSDFWSSIVGQPFGVRQDVVFGLVGGGGLELVVSGPLTAKIEYLYIAYGGTTCVVPCGGGPIRMTPSEHLLRGGLNFKLWSQ
jgi:outer membrane immunogenic protein